MSNARITQVNASVEAEVLAPRTVINWDPTNDTGSILFECAKYYRESGTTNYFGVPEPDGGMSLTLGEVMPKVFTVPTPQGDVQVPAVFIMAAIKSLFNETYYAQRVPAGSGEPVEPEANGPLPL